MSNKTTDTILPSRNESHGYLQTRINNGATEVDAKKAYGELFQRMTKMEFGPLAIRRILDSPIGRHLADMADSAETAEWLFRDWMTEAAFTGRILEITSMTDAEFYGE